MPRLKPFLVLLIAAFALCVPSAAHAGTCNISGKERKLGTTYVTTLSAKGVSCAKAITFVKAFHRCRHRHGAAGRCPSVGGYRCSERRESIAVQYDSRATCVRGSRRIVQTYTQNT